MLLEELLPGHNYSRARPESACEMKACMEACLEAQQVSHACSMQNTSIQFSRPVMSYSLDIVALTTLLLMLHGCRWLTNGEAGETSADGSAPGRQAAAPYNRLRRI